MNHYPAAATRPLVTISIPTFNRSALLRRALESALGQSYRRVEVIVADDGSTDNTALVLASYSDERLKVIRHPRNVGMRANMSSALEAASGEFFLQLSDDDYLEPDCIASLLTPLLNGGATMAYGQWWYHDEAGGRTLQAADAPAEEPGAEYVLQYWQGRRPTILHGVLFRTAILRATGGVPEGFAQDTLMTLRVACEGSVAYVPRPITHYCLQPGSNTHRISLSRLISDRVMLLEATDALLRAAGVDDASIAAHEHGVRRTLAYESAVGLVSSLVREIPRRKLFEEAALLAGTMRHRPALRLLTLTALALLPRRVVGLLRARWGSGNRAAAA